MKPGKGAGIWELRGSHVAEMHAEEQTDAPNERLQRHASVAQRVRCKPGLYGSAETVTARQSEWKEGVERG